MQNSFSWRITGILRAARRFLCDEKISKTVKIKKAPHKISILGLPPFWKIKGESNLEITIHPSKELNDHIQKAWVKVGKRRILSNRTPSALNVDFKAGKGIKLITLILQMNNGDIAILCHRLMYLAPQKGNHPQEIKAKTADQIKLNNLKLEDFEGISFDIFDTALVRLFNKPTDVFKFIEKKHSIPGFTKQRIQWEQESRDRNKNKNDISIHDIYKNRPVPHEYELETESHGCVANSEIFSLYRKALCLNKKIIFVSDMYLSKETIQKILNLQGYTKYDALYVSSEDDLIKGDGSRFTDLKNSIPNFNRYIHIGDNKLADYDWPTRLNFPAIHYQTPESFFLSDDLLASQYSQLSNSKSLSISTLLGAYRYWCLCLKERTNISLWRKIGFFYGGPLITAFAQHIQKSLRSKKNPNLFFLSRDGSIIKKAFELFDEEKRHKAHYLLSSRRCATFPFLKDPEAAEFNKSLEFYTATENDITPDAVISRLAYDEIGNLGLDLNKAYNSKGKLSSQDIENCLRKNMHHISTLASREFISYKKYLNESNLLESDSTIIDVGWSGTIQDYLSKFIPKKEGIKSIAGIYLGVTPHASSSADKSGMLFNPSSTNEAWFNYLDFIEFLTSSPEESIAYFQLNENEQPCPIYYESTNTEKIRQNAATELQQGIMEYCALNKKNHVLKKNIPENDDFLFLFDTLSERASSHVKNRFEEVTHSRLPGCPHSHNLINFKD